MKLCSLQSATSFHLTMQGGALGAKVIPMAPGCCQESGFFQSHLGTQAWLGKGEGGAADAVGAQS